jgi:hypothetical protein
MKEKGCYPQGCLYFLWNCVLLQKGNRCVRGFKHVGRECKGCTHYDEEKIHLQPELLLDEESYKKFQEDLEEFETWLGKAVYKTHAVGGRVQSVKPWFEETLLPHGSHIRIRGALLVLKRGFIGMQAFDDTLYVRVSETALRTYGFVPKMVVEMTGELREDRGRIVIRKPSHIEILKKGWGIPLRPDRAFVAVKTAALLDRQPESCMACPWGALADVVDRRRSEEKKYRHLYCLKGVSEPADCPVPVLRRFRRRKKSLPRPSDPRS